MYKPSYEKSQCRKDKIAVFSLALTSEALIRQNRPLLKLFGSLFFGATDKYQVEGLCLPPTSICC